MKQWRIHLHTKPAEGKRTYRTRWDIWAKSYNEAQAKANEYAREQFPDRLVIIDSTEIMK